MSSSATRPPKTLLVTGAGGFIGSHLCDRLLALGHTVVGIDNLSRGTRQNLSAALSNPTFHFFDTDINDLPALRRILPHFRIDTAWHLAANSDTRAGIADPQVDLHDTFLTTFNLLLLMRKYAIRSLVFSSSSAVYGPHSGSLEESTGPLFPISNYGAMKLASEALISAAVESFLERAWILRLPNIVGPRATHGVVFDLLSKLLASPPDLEVSGDGRQQQPYMHVSEFIDAMLFIYEHAGDPLNCFNIGPHDEGAMVREIAEAVARQAAPSVPLRFTGKGSTGEIPSFRYSVEKLRSLGWPPQLTSIEAVQRAVAEVHQELHAGRT